MMEILKKTIDKVKSWMVGNDDRFMDTDKFFDRLGEYQRNKRRRSSYRRNMIEIKHRGNIIRIPGPYEQVETSEHIHQSVNGHTHTMNDTITTNPCAEVILPDEYYNYTIKKSQEEFLTEKDMEL